MKKWWRSKEISSSSQHHHQFSIKAKERIYKIALTNTYATVSVSDRNNEIISLI